MRLVSSHPKLIDAPGATWPRDVVQKADSNDLQARWEEYQQLGTGGDIDNEWRRLLDRLSPISFSTPQDECRLCGGTGKVRCFRCGGVGSTMSGPGRFQCDCEGGRRECEWCAMS